jgi:hypothetical protein
MLVELCKSLKNSPDSLAVLAFRREKAQQYKLACIRIPRIEDHKGWTTSAVKML